MLIKRKIRNLLSKKETQYTYLNKTSRQKNQATS